jgi:fucose permease
MKKLIKFLAISIVGCSIVFIGMAFIKNSADIAYWGEAVRAITAFCFLIVLGVAILASEILLNNN